MIGTKITSAALYQQVGDLVRCMPDFDYSGPLKTEDNIWLARLSALLYEANDIVTYTELNGFMISFTNAKYRNFGAQRIAYIAHQLLAKTELSAPVSDQGTFVPAGNAFDGLIAVGKIIAGAKKDVLIVDPYVDEKVLKDFAVHASEVINIRLLSDKKGVKATFVGAVRAWKTQYISSRPLQARLTEEKKLHDRIIVIDDALVYSLGQSLNAFALRAPTSIIKNDHDTSVLKIRAYEQIWNEALEVNLST